MKHFLGKLIPFTHILYVDPNNPEIQSEIYKRGYTSIYVKDVKFPSDGDGPFQLVYAPPSFEMDAPGPLTGPLIYKINKEYNPKPIIGEKQNIIFYTFPLLRIH